ncbi:unknown [Clostridium sp. CAG:413]|nr:unknown [Clostridium sp. CAG:413]
MALISSKLLSSSADAMRARISPVGSAISAVSPVSCAASVNFIFSPTTGVVGEAPFIRVTPSGSSAEYDSTLKSLPSST